jgi:hypothetical protein
MHKKISAKTLLRSRGPNSAVTMISMEIDIPRIILAELNTHKILVRNAQSSRAVPLKTSIEKIEDGDIFFPSYWGRNKAGMSASASLSDADIEVCKTEWEYLARGAANSATVFDELKLHKQIAGRILEPFQMIKIVLSGTNWDNFFNLRIHPTAEPHFRDLAIKIYHAIKEAPIVDLSEDQWHLPYISYKKDRYFDSNGTELSLEEAQKVSLSCVAQTSYRKHDESLEKAEDIIGKLFNGDVVHASPAEHLAKPMISPAGFIPFEGCLPFENPREWEDGVTHIDRLGNKWSGQLKHWIQYRQLIPNNVCEIFTDEKFKEYTKDVII